MEDTQYPIEDWVFEYILRKEIPSITHEEFLEMPYHKALFYIKLAEEINEREHEYEKKVFNKGGMPR